MLLRPVRRKLLAEKARRYARRDSWLSLLLQMCLLIPLPRHRKPLQRKGPIHPLRRTLLRSYLLVKKLEMAVVAVTVVQPPLIITVQALMLGEKGMTSFCVHTVATTHRPTSDYANASILKSDDQLIVFWK